MDSRTGSDVISAGEIGLRYRDSGTIERLLKTQKSFLWPVMMSMRRNTVITVDTDYDVPKMDRELEAFSCYKRVNEIMPQDAYLGRNDDGFVVVPEQPGSKLDREAVRRKVMGALDTGETYLSLSGTDFKGVRPSELYGDNKDVDPQNKYGAEAFDRRCLIPQRPHPVPPDPPGFDRQFACEVPTGSRPEFCTGARSPRAASVPPAASAPGPDRGCAEYVYPSGFNISIR